MECDLCHCLVEMVELGLEGQANSILGWCLAACASMHYVQVIQCQKYKGSGSDVWSLGVLLFALAAGRLPFNDRSVAGVMDKVFALLEK